MDVPGLVVLMLSIVDVPAGVSLMLAGRWAGLGTSTDVIGFLLMTAGPLVLVGASMSLLSKTRPRRRGRWMNVISLVLNLGWILFWAIVVIVTANRA